MMAVYDRQGKNNIYVFALLMGIYRKIVVQCRYKVKVISQSMTMKYMYKIR